MNLLSWVSFDRHNDRTGETLISQVQVINDRPVFILYNAGNTNPFRNIALDSAGFKYSQQGVWVCPVENIDLAALRAAFPLMDFEDVATPISQVVEAEENSPNSFLSTMFRNAFSEEYAPGINVKRYEGQLPPAGESLAHWLEQNGMRRSANTFEAKYTEGTNVTVTINKRNREVSVIFHDADFHSTLENLYLRERNEVDAEIGQPFSFQTKMFIRLTDNSYAPAVERSNGVLAFTQFACPSPQEVLRRIDLESLTKVMTETEWNAYQNRLVEAAAEALEPIEAGHVSDIEQPASVEVPEPAEAPEPVESGITDDETPASEEPLEFSPEAHIRIVADSIEQLRGIDIERLLDQASEIGDHALYASYMYVRDNREDLIDDLNSVFDDAAGFLVDSEFAELAALAEERMRFVSGEEQLTHLKAQMPGSVLGKELKHESKESWGFVTPDLEEVGKFRYTLFDTRGFFSHQVHNTEEEAFNALVKEQRYTRWDLGALKAIETTEAFLDGMLNQAKAKVEAETWTAPEEQPANNLPQVPTAEERANTIVTLFKARARLAETALSHDDFRTEKDGKFHAVYFKDHAEPVTYIEGRPSKAKAITGMDYLAVDAVKEVGKSLSQKFAENLQIPPGHSFEDFDIERDIRFVRTAGSSQISCFIRANPDTPLHRQVRTEFRINLHHDQPSAFLSMESGERYAFKGVDLLAASENQVKFPRATTFEELADKAIATFNQVAAEVTAAPEPVTEVQEEIERSDSYSTHKQWIIENPRSARMSGHIEQLQIDTRLEDGESELLVNFIEEQSASIPALEGYAETKQALTSAPTESEILAIKSEIEVGIQNETVMLSPSEKADLFNTIKERRQALQGSPVPILQNEAEQQNAAENAPTIVDEQNEPDPLTNISSHWALEYVNEEAAVSIDQLEEATHRRGYTLHWYTLHREFAGTQLIARVEGTERDVIFNNEGQIPQALSLLDLYIKTNRADLIRSVNVPKPEATEESNANQELISSEESVTTEEPIEVEASAISEEPVDVPQQQPESPDLIPPHIAGEFGEYTPDGLWYNPGEQVPAHAVKPERLVEAPKGQELIYPRIKNFVTPDPAGVYLMRREQIKDSELVNYFNSIEQFNALVDRFNAGNLYYAPEWLKLNFTSNPEVASTLPAAPKGTQPVTQDTPINFSAVIRDNLGTPYMVLTKRHGRMQIAEFEDGKPVVHSDCQVVDIDGQTFNFAGEWWENDQITVDSEYESIHQPEQEAEPEETAIAEPEILSPSTQTGEVVPLFKEDRTLASDKFDLETEMPELVQKLRHADIEFSDISSYLRSVSMLELAEQSPDSPSQFEIARARKALDNTWATLSTKAAAGGIILDQGILHQIAQDMSDRIADATEHDAEPWNMHPDTVKSLLSDQGFIDIVNGIDNDKPLQKALFIAKRLGEERNIRMVERAVEENIHAHPVAAFMLEQFEGFARRTEIETEIEQLTVGNEDTLSTYQWERLQALQEELAELRYEISEMEITSEMIDIFKNTPDYDETFAKLSQLTGMDREGAKVLSERIADKIHADRVAEIRGSDLFKLGQAVVALLPGFTEAAGTETETVGSIIIGPRRASVAPPKLEGDEYHLSISVYPIDRDNEYSTFETIKISKESDNPAQAFATQLSDFLKTYETVVQTADLPRYGAKLFSGENGEKLYSLTEINKRIRSDIKELQKTGAIPASVKVGVRKSNGSIYISIKELPDSIPMITHEYAQWNLENREGHHADAPAMWTADYRALKHALEAVANAYNYDNSDRQTDYFNTNFYLHVEAEHELRALEIERAIEAYKTSLVTEEDTDEEITASIEEVQASQPVVESEPTSSAVTRDRTYALPWEAQNNTASPDLAEISQPLVDHMGNDTGWHSVDISKDNLGLTSGGGTLLINPESLECVAFESGDRPAQEAYVHAVAFAMENPVQPHPAAVETTAVISPKDQPNRAEENVAKLLAQLNLASVDFSNDDDWHFTIENDPFMDLVIELHPSLHSGEQRSLYLTHYTGDEERYMDAEMVFEVKRNGTLELSETAVFNPLSGGELRGNDRSFANLMSNNLLIQGFGEGQVINNKAESSALLTPETTTENIDPVDQIIQAEQPQTAPNEGTNWETAPLKDFKAHLDQIKATDDDPSQVHYTMLLGYRFGFGKALSRAQEIDLRIENGTATTADRAMLQNLQNVWKKHLDDALDKETNDEPTSRSSLPSDSQSDVRRTDNEPAAEAAAGNVSNNEQRHDPEESGVTDERVSGEKPSSAQSGLHSAGKLPGRPADVPEGNAEQDDRSDSIKFQREVTFFPREEMLRMEGAQPDTVRANFTQTISILRKILEEDYQPTEQERLSMAATNGAAHSAITEAFKSSSYTTEAGRELQSELKSLFKYNRELHQSLKASVTDAYYTPTPITNFMWNAVTKMGVSNADHPLHITEPSIGSGRFIGLAPEQIRAGAVFTGIEKDSFTAQLTQAVYPEVQIINEGFEDVVLPKHSQDLIIGNPPYGEYTVYDKREGRQHLIHDYFLMRSIELAKPGGIVAFVTSSGTLDKANSATRHRIAASADLVTAYRLPASTFKKTGASVVTDVLFFQKRHPNQEQGPLNWLEVAPIDVEHHGEDSGFRAGNINQFYLDNPDNVLGNIEWSHGKFGTTLTVTGDLSSEQLVKVLADDIPSDIFSATQHTSHRKQDAARIMDDPRFAGAKIGSYVSTDDGIFIVNSEGVVPHSSSGKRAQKLAAVIGIRDLTLSLIDTEKEGLTDDANQIRESLNTAYDEFQRQYGYLNARTNKNLLALDPDHYLVLALEAKDPNSDDFLKADIFSNSFQALSSKTASIESVSDAVIYLMNTEGTVSQEAVAELLEVESHDIQDQLTEICFKNPTTDFYELKALYLSGNIYQKLESAKTAAKYTPEYQRNVDALEAVLPAPIEIGDINTRLGASWIPFKLVQAFIAEQLGSPIFDDRVRLTFVPETHTWDLRLTQAARNAFYQKNEVELAAGGYRFEQLITKTLNQQVANVRDQDGNLDPELTTLAKAKQKEILQEFRRFILADAERCDLVSEAYNKKFNAYKEAEYDGSYMTFPGMSGVINGKQLKLREHQPAVIERILHSDTGVLIAHEAGAGKTIEQIAAAMQMKRLGQASKPLLVIPNHMLKQATNEARDLYPNAKILTATPQDFEAGGRALFASKVQLNDWDLVICTHSMFTAMAPPADFVKHFIMDEIDQYETAIKAADHSDRITIKALEKAKKSLESTLKKRTGELEKRQDDISFEECGFDALFYDEGHYLKNYAPPSTLKSVAGVNSQTSNRAMDAVIKADFIRYKRGDEKGVNLASGTPITNSVSEAWVMLRLVAPSLLRETGLDSFDNFAATFCEVVEHIELKPEGGGYQMKSRLSRFHNVPELIRIFRMVADIKMAEDLNLPTPEATDIKHVAPQSSEMRLFMDWLTHRAINVRQGDVEPSEDNILSIANDGRSASLDLRLIHELLPDDPNSKVNMCVKNVHDKYIQHAEDRRTQIVFCDRGTPKPGFNLYDDMKQKWVAMGIPAEEIAFIHEAKNDEQKEAIFAKVRAGEIRILLGSTDKLGVGTNVQTRGSDLHMLDIPWRPTDLKQRRKRFERQGNLFEDVNIHFYTTEDSFDLFMLETAVRKLKFITQAMSSPEKAARRLDEDIDPTLSEIMAITTGNSLIKDKVEVDSKVDQLLLLRNAHDSDCRRFLGEAAWIEEQRKPSYEDAVKGITKSITAIGRDNLESGIIPFFINGKTFIKPKEIGVQIHDALKHKLGSGNTVAEIAGYPLKSRVEKDHFTLVWEGPTKLEVNLTKDPARFVNNLIKKMMDMDHLIAHYQQTLNKLDADIESYRERANKPFADAAELEDLLARQIEINTEVSKMEQDLDQKLPEGILHDFENLLSELNARLSLLSDDEIEMYQQAANNPSLPKTLNGPGV